MDKVPTVGTEAGVLYCPSLDPNKLSWMGDSSSARETGEPCLKLDMRWRLSWAGMCFMQ